MQAGNAHVLGAYWFGFGPTEAMLVLDDLERTLLGAEAGIESGEYPVVFINSFQLVC